MDACLNIASTNSVVQCKKSLLILWKTPAPPPPAPPPPAPPPPAPSPSCWLLPAVPIEKGDCVLLVKTLWAMRRARLLRASFLSLSKPSVFRIGCHCNSALFNFVYLFRVISYAVVVDRRGSRTRRIHLLSTSPYAQWSGKESRFLISSFPVYHLYQFVPSPLSWLSQGLSHRAPYICINMALCKHESK